ncbi:MAG: hypothetical protein ACTSWN_11010 [Promethearchaeota archaeon]
MAVKPVVRDIVVNLINAPKGLLLGNKQYPLNFLVINLKNQSKKLLLSFSSDSLKLDNSFFEIQLGSREKKNLTLNVTPVKDGYLELALDVVEKKEIKYTEAILEGEEIPEQEPPQEIKAVPASKPAKTGTKPLTMQGKIKPTKPIVKTMASGVKPVKAVAKPGATLTKPVKPILKGTAAKMKPVKTGIKPSIKKVKPTTTSKSISELETKLLSIKDEYMSERAKLQSIDQNSPEYKDIYKHALALKKEYDNLKKLLEQESSAPELKPAPAEKDIIQELKELMAEYNKLKSRLSSMGVNHPEYSQVKQRALGIYKTYNEKRKIAKDQGLIS